MEVLTIETTADFVEYVDKISLQHSPRSYNIWFRAESDEYEKTQLIPNIYREYYNAPITVEDFKQKELNLISTFKNEAYQHLVNHQLTSHEAGTYFLMQHYGMHTRLLDWTENALISLFFAVENEYSETDSVVWILDPYELNYYTLSKSGLESEAKYCLFTCLNRDIRVGTYLQHSTFREDHDGTKLPIAIKPFYIDERIRNQSACFTLFGHEKDGLRKHPDMDVFLHKVKIPKNRLRKIKVELFRLGISYDSIYPGLDGISKKIMYASSIGAY